jgi:hypothetical protein
MPAESKVAPVTGSVEELLVVEERFDRSFRLAVVAFITQAGWPVLARLMGVAGLGWATTVLLLLAAGMIASYAWFAYSAAIAASRLGRSGLLIGAWIALAPIVSLLQIPVVSTLIGASPLSIRFLLAGELRSEIHAKTLA